MLLCDMLLLWEVDRGCRGHHRCCALPKKTSGTLRRCKRQRNMANVLVEEQAIAQNLESCDLVYC
eukprot:scaffold106_cov246-Pinguiococcus_pyrenoidosus.AAC.3